MKKNLIAWENIKEIVHSLAPIHHLGGNISISGGVTTIIKDPIKGSSINAILELKSTTTSITILKSVETLSISEPIFATISSKTTTTVPEQ